MVYASHFTWFLLASLLGLALVPNLYRTNEETARILSVSVSISIAYLPFFFALYSASRISPTPTLWRIVWATALLVRLLCFFSPALLSDDTLRYEWEARTLLSGLNPYLTSPRDLSEPNLRIPGYDFPAVYGPLIEALQGLTLALHLPAKASGAFAELLLLILSSRAGLPFHRWLLLAWSPLAITEFWLNGHNDSWLILLLFLALTTTSARSWLFLALATLTKWWPALLVPIWLARSASLPGLAIFTALLLSCFFLMPPDAWLTKVRFTSGFLGGWQNNPFLYRFLTDKWQSFAVSLTAAISLPFARLPRHLLTLAFITTFLAFSGNIHPWYLSWLLPPLLLSSINPLPWLLPSALLPLAYNPMFGWALHLSWTPDPQIPQFIWSATTLFAIYAIINKRTG